MFNESLATYSFENLEFWLVSMEICAVAVKCILDFKNLIYEKKK